MAGSSNEKEMVLEHLRSLMRHGKPRNALRIIENNPSDISRNNENPKANLPTSEKEICIFPKNGDSSDILQNYGNASGSLPNYQNTSEIFPKTENPRENFPNLEHPIDFFQRFATQIPNVVPQTVNPEPDLDLGLSLGMQDHLALNGNARSCSMPAESGQVNHRVSRRVTGKAPAVAARPKLQPWMVAGRAMAKIIESSASVSSSSPMHGPISSTVNLPPVVPSKWIEKGQSAYRANKAPLRGPMAGCKIAEHGICDSSAHDDLVREAKRAKNSGDKVIPGVSATDMLTELMPSVVTEGPNLRKVEGFLYKYCEENDITIVCICHGHFLTPTEFIKHAGGGDVPNPLRHIKIFKM